MKCHTTRHFILVLAVCQSTRLWVCVCVCGGGVMQKVSGYNCVQLLFNLALLLRTNFGICVHTSLSEQSGLIHTYIRILLLCSNPRTHCDLGAPSIFVEHYQDTLQPMCIFCKFLSQKGPFQYVIDLYIFMFYNFLHNQIILESDFNIQTCY